MLYQRSPNWQSEIEYRDMKEEWPRQTDMVPVSGYI